MTLVSIMAGASIAATVASAAAITNQRPLLFGFNGEGASAGRFKSVGTNGARGLNAVAVDAASGDIYVVDGGNEAVDKFNATGEAEDFPAGPAAGSSSLRGPTTGQTFKAQNERFFLLLSDLAVDNSGGLGGAGEGEQGRLYVSGSGSGGPIDAFDPQGNLLWILNTAAVKDVCGITVDAEGHLWVGTGSSGKVLEFASSGSPPAMMGEFGVTSGNKSPCRLGIDQAAQSLYIAQQWNLGGSPSPSLDKYVGGIFDSTLSMTPTRAVSVDQAKGTGHIFTLENGFGAESTQFKEYQPCTTPGCGASPVGSFGPDQIGDGRGIVYNPGKDWVYVSDFSTETVKVFGPLASGTAPDVTIEAADGISKTEATAHGTINPLNVPNSYHFEWVRGEAQHVSLEATGGTFRLSTGGSSPNFSAELPFDISAAALQGELEALYGLDNVSVLGIPAAGGVPGEYDVIFRGDLAGHTVKQMVADASALTGGAHEVVVRTVTDGQSWAAAEPQPTWPEANPSIEPSDSVNHAVSQTLAGLRPNTTYDVRLVGTNTEPEGNPEKRLDSYSNAQTFTTLPPPPPSVASLSISSITAESAHVATTIDPSGDETIWQILTSTEGVPGASQSECEALSRASFQVAIEGTIPLGEPGTVSIAQDLTGLEHGQTYCVRLIATNGGGHAPDADAVFTTEVVKPSEVKLAFAAPRTDTTAVLNFYANPEGEAPLEYRFEYSTDSTNWIPLEDAISETEARQQIVVAEKVSGLAPGTTYFYRLGFVKNEAGSVTGLAGNRSFTTRTPAEMALPSNALGEPERRGIELVNNHDKGNQHVLVTGFLSGSSAPITADGNKLVWTLAGGAPGGTSGVYNAFLAERDAASGWHSRAIMPPVDQQIGDGSLKYRAEFASPDFTRFIFRTEGGLFPGEDSKSTYLRLDDDQHQEVLAHFDVNAFATPVDVTADTAHVLHVAEDTNLLEDIGSGTPEVVGLMSGGSPPPCGIHFGTEFAGITGNSPYGFPGYHWIASSDAGHVYFQTRGGECDGTEGLYLRNRITGTTTRIAQDASFIRATPDGKSAFFVTTEQLAKIADQNADLDVYEWTEGKGSVCLTCIGKEVKDANVSPVHGGVRVSDDSSHVYFFSTSQLVPGLGREGDLNLYVVSDGKIHFVADPNDPNAMLGPGQMEMSTDGNVLVFLSSTPLTADRIGASCVNTTEKAPHPCRELYRYDDRDGSLECVSCVHDGATVGDVFTETNNGGDAFRMSGDGTTIAFTTPQAVLPEDVNGGYDVYEWRTGAVRLITDGETKFPTGLAAPDVAGIDSDGEDVFFVLTDPGLTGFEGDGVDNVYDARIGGGFPRPSTPSHCSEESCQGPLQSAREATRPASAGFRGAGNVAPRPCRRHRVRRHGHCVKRRGHTRHGKRAGHAQGGGPR